MLIWQALTALVLFVGDAASASSQHPTKPAEYKRLPSLRKQAAIEEKWVKGRLDLVPAILEKYGFDAYLLSMREYGEDTLFRSINPYTTTFSARRRTAYLFYSSPPSVSSGIPPSPLILIDNNSTRLFDTVKETLELLDPKRIAVNEDVAGDGMAFSDGLHAGEGQVLRRELGEKWVARFGVERMIPVEIIAARVGGKEQLKIHKDMQESVWAMIEEGFSSKAITPKITTSEDLEWWFREKMETMNVTTWFHPSVSLFRSDFQTNPDQPFPSPGETSMVIQEGDMIHVDIGIYAMGMATDTQHLAYVLRPHETDAPAGLKHGLKTSNGFQDLVRSQMSPGRTGDDVLGRVHAQMAEDGMEGLIYCHPIGDFGHSAGTPIGMTNLQKSVPVSGQLPMLPSWYSIELSASVFVPEWNRTQSFFQEEDVYFDEQTQGWEWVYGRQERFHLIDESGKQRHADLEVAHEEGKLVIQEGRQSRFAKWW